MNFVRLQIWLMCVALLPVTVHAQFIFTTNNGAIVITGYTGPGGAVVVPATTNGLPVTAIASGAFQNLSLLNSITIPASVTNILDFAFAGCPHLAGVYFLGNAPGIGGANLFQATPGATVFYQPGTSGWTSLIDGRPTVMLNPPSPAGSLKVTLSPAAAITNGMQWQVDGGVTQFSEATVLGLSVGNHTVTFSSANGWAIPASENVVIGANATTTTNGIYGPLSYVTNSGTITITQCTNGVALVLPNAINGLPVTVIGNFVFQNITTLTSVTIPASVTNLWDYAFELCGNLTAVYFLGNAPVVDANSSSVFSGDSAVTSYYLPGTSGWNSQYCARPAVMLNPPSPAGSLKVTLAPATVIAAGLQWQVDGGIQQPGGATVSGLSVGNHTVTFSSANGWAVPASESVVINANATTSTNAIYGQLTYVTNNGTITITQCTNGGALILPATINGLPITSIGGAAFQNISTLTSITIPASVSNIWDYAFQECNNLTAAYFQGNFPGGYVNGYTAFTADPNTTIYYLPGTSGWGSFFGGRPAAMLNPPNPNGSLKVTIAPATVATNGAQWQVDGGITQTNGAVVLGLSVGNHTVSFNPLNGWAMPASQNVAVSANSTTTFNATYGQLTYVTNNGVIDILKFKGSGATVLPGTINGRPVAIIDSQAFENNNNYNNNLTSVEIPNTVTNIGSGAFSMYNDLPGLISISVDPGNQFYSSTNGILFNQNQTVLIEAPIGIGGNYTIPQTVTNIGDGAFDNCPLTSVTIPDSVVIIEPAAFYGCISLTNVTFGTNVTEIEDQAFQACYSLTNIVLPKKLNVLGTWTFAFCYNLTSVYFQGNLPSLYFSDYPPFTDDTNATIYYLPSATGWDDSSIPFGDAPATLWLPQAQTGTEGFGGTSNQFGFNITWANNTVVVVDACTDPSNPVWTPVGTNTLTGGSSYFSDPDSPNLPARYYRLRSQQ